MRKAPIVLALDTPDLSTAIAWVRATHAHVSIFKLGLEFFLNFGSEGVRAIQAETDSDIFLDLKLHDIPHTVSRAASAVSNLSPKFLTVHASGGTAMVKAASDAIPQTHITGVTILTSMSEADVSEVGYKYPALDTAVSLSKVAVDGGARAIVCSPLEIVAVRAAIGDAPLIITPGVRPLEMAGLDDQQRTMTPEDAISAGANFVVIGRPITQLWPHGASAMSDKAAEIGSRLI